MADSLAERRSGMNMRLGAMITTGLVMYAFVVMHLVNLIFGLHSVEMIDAWRPYLSGVWSWRPLNAVLALSLFVHFVLALVAVYKRSSLKMPIYDSVQMVTALLVLPLLVPHVSGVIAAHALGAPNSYAYLLSYFWVDQPTLALRQVLLLAVVWLHGSIGVFTWLRVREGRSLVLIAFYPLVVLIPLLALLGFVEAGLQVVPDDMGGTGVALAQVEAAQAAFVPVSEERAAVIIGNMNLANTVLVWGSLILIGAVLLARAVRIMALPKDALAYVNYADLDEASMSDRVGLSLYEMTLKENVPTAGLCRGRGRCGTCRVRILSADYTLPPPSAAEAKTLARVDAGPDVRLACQIKPQMGQLEVERVISPDYSNMAKLGQLDEDMQEDAA